jgi:hypothetical protein
MWQMILLKLVLSPRGVPIFSQHRSMYVVVGDRSAFNYQLAGSLLQQQPTIEITSIYLHPSFSLSLCVCVCA